MLRCKNTEGKKNPEKIPKYRHSESQYINKNKKTFVGIIVDQLQSVKAMCYGSLDTLLFCGDGSWYPPILYGYGSWDTPILPFYVKSCLKIETVRRQTTKFLRVRSELRLYRDRADFMCVLNFKWYSVQWEHDFAQGFTHLLSFTQPYWHKFPILRMMRRK